MAELILAVVALGVAGPGMAVSFAECGQYITSKIESFKHAPAIAIKVGSFGHELHCGQLKENLALAEWAYAQHNIDQSLKSVLEDHVDRLRQGLIEVDKQLDRCFDKKGNVKRTKFMYSGERNIRASISELEQWQRSFWGMISLIEMRRRVLPDPLLLTAERFKLSVQKDGQFLHCLAPDSHIWLGKAQLLDGTLRDVEVMVERKRKITTSATEVRQIAMCLSHLSSQNSPRGILRCLGYREEPNLELIFELPKEFTQLQTLENLIEVDLGLGSYAGRRPLDCRFRLAHQICEATLSVHTSNLVHKNIRPDTILMIDTNTKSDNSLDSRDFGVR